MSQDYVYIVKLCSEDHHTDKWDVFVEKDEVGVFYDRKEANRAAIKALERWFEPRELIESRELYMDRRYGIAVMPHHVFSDRSVLSLSVILEVRGLMKSKRCEGSSFKIEILIKPVDAKGTSRGRAQGNSLETASRSARSTTRLTSLGPQSSNKKMTVKGTQLQVVKRLFYQVRDMRYLDYDATEEEGEPHIETFTYFSTKEAANNYVVSEAGYGDPDDRLDEMENVEQDDEGFADIEQE